MHPDRIQDEQLQLLKSIDVSLRRVHFAATLWIVLVVLAVLPVLLMVFGVLGLVGSQ